VNGYDRKNKKLLSFINETKRMGVAT
jgi:hypothetical protein